MRLIFSPLEQFEISSFNTSLKYISSYPIELFEHYYSIPVDFLTGYRFYSLCCFGGILFILQPFLNVRKYLFLVIITFSILSQINLLSFNNIVINNIKTEYFPVYEVDSELMRPLIDVIWKESLNYIDHYVDNFILGLPLEYNPCGTTDCKQKRIIQDPLTYFNIVVDIDNKEGCQRTTNIISNTIITGINDVSSIIDMYTIHEMSGVDLSIINYDYITTLTSYVNIYSVSFCFIFTYMIIYLLYNRVLSNNTNTLVPNIYKLLGEKLSKISVNLFYSILGKDVSIPEFVIKINTIFIFLILSNVQGMIPYLSTLTSALTNTFYIALALFISIIKTILDKKGVNYLLNLFMPSGCPILLSLLIIPIEIISYSFRLVSLSVRLFANMMAGHTLLKVIVGFSWIIVFSGSTFFINIFPIVILFVLTLLEFGVALIQAYIFTVLSCIYLRDIFEGH